MTARVIKPAEDVTRVVIVEEVCPCGSRYVSGSHRDAVLFAAWADVHVARCGMRVEGR